MNRRSMTNHRVNTAEYFFTWREKQASIDVSSLLGMICVERLTDRTSSFGVRACTYNFLLRIAKKMQEGGRAESEILPCSLAASRTLMIRPAMVANPNVQEPKRDEVIVYSRRTIDERLTYIRCYIQYAHAVVHMFLSKQETIEGFMALRTFEVCRACW